MHWTQTAKWASTLALVLLLGCPKPPDGPRFMGAGHNEAQHGGTFVFHHESTVKSLDPHMAFDELSNMAIKLMFDGLLDYDNETNMVPMLAKSLPSISDDGKTFIFELRKGIRFHNGRALTAHDVRWSMEHMLDPDVGSPGFTFYTQLQGVDAYREKKTKHISGITVKDNYTIEFQLTEPDQTFLNAMAMTFAYPVPKEVYEKYPMAVSQHIFGTGAFKLQEWESGVKLVFGRNKDYWDKPRPYPDTMVYLENLTRDAAMMRFRNGELDHAHRFAPADYLFLKNSSKWAPYRAEYADINLWGVVMNCGMPPFNNVHLRRAVSFALDREGWKKARNNRLRVTDQPIPPPLLGYDPELKGRQTYDIAKAKEEMRLAGYPEGLPEEVDMWIGHGNTGRFYGELTQQDLAKIGIKIRLKPVAFALYLEETGKPNRVPMMMSGWSQDFPDPADFLDILFHSRAIHEHDSENRSFYRNPKLDALLDKGRIEQDKEKRRVLYLRASEILAQDAPWAFMWNDLKTEAWQPYVKGYTPHPVWSEMYRDVWLDLPRRRIAQAARRFKESFFALLGPLHKGNN
ncbi:MAG: ABC transporter substrate-binding protein [Myxococcales bacterium]|nr:MAG: ABC transporter substrate-binding protein [Myxococcales bacterium]